MKKRMLSALLALCMMLTMVPTVAFAVEDGSDQTIPPVENVLINEDGAGKIDETSKVDETGETDANAPTEQVTPIDVSLVVGDKNELLEGQGEGEEGHIWTLSEGGDKYVTLKTYTGKNAHYVQVTGISGGSATLTHTWGTGGENKEVYNITVKGFTVADALEQIFAKLADTVALPDGMNSLDATFTLNAYKYGSTMPKRWEIDSNFSPISLEATLDPGGNPVQLTPVNQEDTSIDLNQENRWFTCYVISFDDPDGEGNLESNDIICFRVWESKITFYYMTDFETYPITEVPENELAAATTITVSGEVAPPLTDPAAYIKETEVKYDTLQDALDAAEEGQTVVLCKNLTDVAVTVATANLTLDLDGHTLSGQKHPALGEPGSGSDPQPGTTTPAAITIGSNATGAGEADQPQIESFTLKNGIVSVGTGLRLYNDLKNLTVQDVVFKDNFASNATQTVAGSAVHWEDGSPRDTVPGSSATFERCDFLDNGSYYGNSGAAQGGAVMIANVEKVSFTDCAFTGNESRGLTQDGKPNGVGGAVYLGYCGSAYFNDCTFKENTMDGSSGGGAIHTMYCGNTRFTGCTFTDNHSEGGAGGAVALTYSTEEAQNIFEACTFTGNTAANSGGAIWISEADVTLGEDCIVTENSASAGGAMMLQGDVDAVVNCDLSDNSATQYNGGAILVYGQVCLTVNGNLTDNKAASSGGAIYAKWTQDSATGAVSTPKISINGNVTENSCAGDGGAVYSNIANIIVNGTVIGNTANGNGGGVYSFNGAPEYYLSTVDLTNASVYNNTAKTAGADIYHTGGTLKISKVGSNWILDDCNHLISGWYSDDEGTRWSDNAPTDAFTGFIEGVATITQPVSLIAAHGAGAESARTVTITPADIVIYTGGTGYGGVTVNEDGIIVSDPTESGLPEPGYHLELSPDVESWLQEQTQDQGAEDLSQYLTFTYQGTDGQDGTTSREWNLHNAGIYDADAETGATTRYVYTLDPATVGGESIPVRILYFEDINANGKYDVGETIRENDDFLMDENIVYNTYAMTINPGELDQGQIKAKLNVNGQVIECNVAIGTGDLMVKSVDEPEYTNIAAEQNDVSGDNIVAVPNETVNYYVNDSEVKVENTDNRVQLLVDDVSNSEEFNNALGEAATKKVTGLDNVKFATQYLDLVDTANGNAVVTLGDEQKLTLYWPVPSNAADDSAFHIVHYTDMDRTNVTDADALDTAAFKTQEGERVPIGGKDYIKFETGSFSPFVLVYEGKSGSTGGTTRYTLTYESNGGTEYDSERYTRNTVVELDKAPTREGYTFTGWYADEDLEERITEIKMTSDKTVYAGWEITGIPEWLNGDDHFAYVIGYEDGTVRPASNISRAEVATIFFRLLDPEIRDENLTDENMFADVSKGVWYNQAISTMTALGIVNGRTDMTFEPDAPITRAEFAAICARFDTNKRDGDSNFTDIFGHWAEAEIERAATLGWINGYEDGTFRPDAEITRAEAMTLINRVLQRLPETADDLLDDMTTWPDCQPNAWYYLAVQEATNSHDFERKDDGVHESWTELTENTDWEQYQ